MNFTEMVFRLWGCCIITAICVSAAVVFAYAVYAENLQEKKKAHLCTGEPEDVNNTSSNLHN